MPTELFANTAVTTITAALTDGIGTSVSVASSTLFPVAASAPPATQFRVKVDAEIMIVTNVAGLTWTVTRAAEGTIGMPHGSGSIAAHVVTAAALASFSAGWLDRLARPDPNVIPASLNDEFNDGAIDSSWLRSDDQRAGASWDESGDTLSVLIRGSQGSGPNHCLTKPLGAIVPPFEIMTTTRILTPFGYNYLMNGPIVSGGGKPGDGGNWVWSRNYTNNGAGAAVQVSMDQGTTLIGEVSGYAPMGNYQWMAPVIHQRLTVLGGGWFENAISVDGVHWVCPDVPWGPSILPTDAAVSHVGLAACTWTDTTKTVQVAFDYFRVRALGPNLCRAPVGGGTVIATASSQYNSTYVPGAAIDGDFNVNAHLLGNTDAVRWWQVNWTTSQAMTRIDVWDPTATDGWGETRFDFSDGSSVGPVTLMHSGHQTFEFPRKTGITWMKIVGVGAAAGNAGVNPGLKEVRVHDAS